MARPERRNADYFPFYAKDGRTLHILEGKYDCKGTGFFTNVMRFLTLQDDHHFCIQDLSDKMYFFSKCKCDEETGMDMLNIMSKTRKLHTCMWVSHAVIASQDHLDSLEDAYRQRKNDIITMDEIMVYYGINPQEGVVPNAGNSQEGVVSNDIKPQSKAKETKVKKRREQAPDHFEFHVGEFLDNILLYCQKLDKLESLNKKRFNPYMWIQVQANNKGHPAAILDTLEQLFIYWGEIDNPWTYGNKIIATKSGNYHEADHIKQHQEFKKAFDIDPRIKELLKPIGE